MWKVKADILTKESGRQTRHGKIIPIFFVIFFFNYKKSNKWVWKLRKVRGTHMRAHTHTELKSKMLNKILNYN